MITPDGVLTTLAGDGYAPGYPGYAGDGGPANQADLNEPVGLALDDAGNLWIADKGNHCIRYVDPDGIIHTLAGSGLAEFADGVGTAAGFHEPFGIEWRDGFLYVADRLNSAVRRVDTTTAEVTTVATGLLYPRGVGVGPDGSIYVADSESHVIQRIDPDGSMEILFGQPGVPAFADGAIEDALLNFPNDVAVSPSGDLYVVDTFNDRLRVAPGLALR
jgi:DNA-binding beta-propeller fold protein YncE